MAVKVSNGVRSTGDLFGLIIDVLKGLPRRPFQTDEFFRQAWFIASVTVLPTALVSIPFGAVIALQLGALTRQLGAESLQGAAVSVGIIREAAPAVTALMIAGAGGTAICADLGGAQDPRGDRCHGGAGHRPDPSPGGPAGAGGDAGRAAAQRRGAGPAGSPRPGI